MSVNPDLNTDEDPADEPTEYTSAPPEVDTQDPEGDQ